MTGRAVRLGHLAQVDLGKMLQPTARSEADLAFPYLRAAHVQPNGQIVDLGVEQTMWFSPVERTHLALRIGDVVVVEGGAGYGRSALVDGSISGWPFQNSIIRVRPRPGALHPGFLNYHLQSDLMQGRISLTANTATIPHFTAEKVRAHSIALLPIAEQRAIADFLDRETAKIDALIEKQTELITRLRERQTSVVTEAVTNRSGSGDGTLHHSRVIPGAPWLGEIPKGWTDRPLWTMFHREKRLGHLDEPMVSVFRDHGVVFKADFENLNVTAEDRSIYQLVDPGWLVVNRMKAWQGSLGVSDIRGISSGHYLCFRPTHSEDHRYLNWLLRSAPYRDGLAQISRGVRPGQAEVDNDLLKGLPIILPPLADQREIVQVLDRETTKIDELVGKTERMIELSRERRSALITAAVAGQIDVAGQGDAA